jgi:hypothetical protein
MQPRDPMPYPRIFLSGMRLRGRSASTALPGWRGRRRGRRRSGRRRERLCVESEEPKKYAGSIPAVRGARRTFRSALLRRQHGTAGCFMGKLCRGTPTIAPSRLCDQAWLGHTTCSPLPRPSVSFMPPWRQASMKAHTRPASSPTSSTGTSTRDSASKSPGSGSSQLSAASTGCPERGLDVPGGRGRRRQARCHSPSWCPRFLFRLWLTSRRRRP